jgi:hypothetical protein
MEISGRLRILCEKLARRISWSGGSAKYMKVSFQTADGKICTKREESDSPLMSAKSAVSERPFMKHTAEQTLRKWTVSGVPEQPPPAKQKVSGDECTTVRFEIAIR